jgi:hypothetical protein
MSVKRKLLTTDEKVQILEEHKKTKALLQLSENNETDIARIVALRLILDDEAGELEISKAYNQDVKNSVKSYQEALSMIQQLEEFSKKKECTTSLQHL